jgi:hypothetical protein
MNIYLENIWSLFFSFSFSFSFLMVPVRIFGVLYLPFYWKLRSDDKDMYDDEDKDAAGNCKLLCSFGRNRDGKEIELNASLFLFLFFSLLGEYVAIKW